MQNGKKLWYFTIYDVISVQKYNLLISLKKWFKIESNKMKSIINIRVILIQLLIFKSENRYTT